MLSVWQMGMLMAESERAITSSINDLVGLTDEVVAFADAMNERALDAQPPKPVTHPHKHTHVTRAHTTARAHKRNVKRTHARTHARILLRGDCGAHSDFDGGRQ